jgi:polar amino acid transport system substrate-binding protein
MNRAVTGALAAALTLAGLAGCAKPVASGQVPRDCKPAHEFETVQDGTLTVTTFDLPPFTQVKGHELAGVDGDILYAIAERECLTVTVVPQATAANIPTVKVGRADLTAAAWYRTAERAKIVALSDPLYTDQMGIISKQGISAIPELKGRTVGTVDGYLWVQDLQKYLGSDLKIYSTTLNMYQDLAAGRLDVGVDSFGSGEYNAEGLRVEVAQPLDAVAASQQGAQIAYPINADNAAMLEAVNEDIAELRTSGELGRILERNGLDRSAGDVGEPELID